MTRPAFSLRAAMTLCALLLTVSLGLAAALAPAPARAQPAAEAAAPAQLDALEIATRKGVVVLEVEVARTPKQRETGLMYRKSMPERHGMLFDFETMQPVYMWMKNTFIPLDMLFIRTDGTIARIEAMTTPFSERTISSGEPVRAVLELNGGAAQRLGIAPGDRVSTSLFKR